jgi:pantoate--beta-alanine ligase
MEVIATKAEIRRTLRATGKPVVLVPTMGALHEGHLSLIRHAREIAGPQGTVAVSIFVNPIQFDRASDLEAYPRPMEADLEACRAERVDVVFAPGAGEMYESDRSVTVTESVLSKDLCGAARPGHFDGVCTVVLKLFLITGCDVAVFGEKDFQQLAVIRRMVRDLDVPVEIIAHETVREQDGLAMSSRNVRLTPEHRAAAPRIRFALAAARNSHSSDAAEIIGIARKEIMASHPTHIDYLELVDQETLHPVKTVVRPATLAAAVFYGDVRLIDHITIHPHAPGGVLSI